MDVAKKLDKVEKFIIEGELGSALNLLLEISKSFSDGIYQRVMHLSSQYNQFIKRRNLGLTKDKDDTESNIILNSTIQILQEISMRSKALEEIDAKLLIEYPAIPKSSYFNEEDVFLRGKKDKIFIWAAKGKFQIQEVETYSGWKSIITIDMLVYNYRPTIFRVMNFSKSSIKLYSDSGELRILESFLGVRGKNNSNYGAPNIVEVNNKIVESSRVHYFDIPPYSFIVVNNSYETNKLEYKYRRGGIIVESLNINLTNNLGEDIILSHFTDMLPNIVFSSH